MDSHYENFKTLGHSVQDIMLLHSNIALLACAGEDVIVEIPIIDNIDKSFGYIFSSTSKFGTGTSNMQKALRLFYHTYCVTFGE